MSGCQCKSGFFALRDCEGMVAGRCGECRRAICRRHAADPTLTRCLDCAASERRKSSTSATTSRRSRSETTHSYDDDWVHERRDRMHGSAPAAVAGVTAGSVAFDAQDARAFDQLDVEQDDGGRDDGREPHGFGDS